MNALPLPHPTDAEFADTIEGERVRKRVRMARPKPRNVPPSRLAIHRCLELRNETFERIRATLANESVLRDEHGERVSLDEYAALITLDVLNARQTRRVPWPVSNRAGGSSWVRDSRRPQGGEG